MNKDTNEPSLKQTAEIPQKSKAFTRRLALLKTEVGLDFPDLIPELEAGQRVILITDQKFAAGLDPDILRRLGGMVTLCGFYGAAVVFANLDKVHELGEPGRSDLNPTQ